MLSLERQQAILEYIRQHHSAKVSELSSIFFMSETSIRRDLHKLERAGLIHKTYGGAVLVQGDNEVISLEARQQLEHEAKVVIARKAAATVSNGQVIFLDSSSTALAMVPFLDRLTNLSVITNGLKVAAALAEHPQFKVYVLGGLLNTRALSMRGTLTLQMLQELCANRLYVSPRSVDHLGNVFCADEEEAAARRMMMRLSDETILLCNAKKLGQRAAFRLCGLAEVSTIICDEQPDAEWLSPFINTGLKIL